MIQGYKVMMISKQEFLVRTQLTAKAGALQQVSTKIGEAVYAQSQSSTSAPPSSSENIVDAEFTEVEDDTKTKKSA
jgi:hypothetical protein